MSLDMFEFDGKTYDIFLVEKMLSAYANGRVTFRGDRSECSSSSFARESERLKDSIELLSKDATRLNEEISSYGRMTSKGVAAHYGAADLLTDVEEREWRTYGLFSSERLALATMALERKRESLQRDLERVNAKKLKLNSLQTMLSQGECPRCHRSSQTLAPVAGISAKLSSWQITLHILGDYPELCGDCCSEISDHVRCPICGDKCEVKGLLGLKDRVFGMDETAIRATLLILPMLRWYLEMKGVSFDAAVLSDKVFACPSCVHRLLNGKAVRPLETVSFLVGSTVSGTVTGVDRVVQVDLDGVPATLPFSELSWAYVVSPLDVVQVGKRYDFLLQSIEADHSNAVVSLKRLMPDPWLKAPEKYACGTVVEGTVNRLSRNGDGAILDLEYGVSGFLPRKEYPARTVAEIALGTKVKVRVTSVQPEERKMSLSARIPSAWSASSAASKASSATSKKAKLDPEAMEQALHGAIADAHRQEVLIDGLNIAKQFDTLKSKTLMLLVWGLEQSGFTWRIVFDASAPYQMKKTNDVVGQKFLDYLQREKPGSCEFCSAGTRADDCILLYANTHGNHVISCDRYGEYAGLYPWVKNLTEDGRRVHPISYVLGELQVPSLGLSVPVPLEGGGAT